MKIIEQLNRIQPAINAVADQIGLDDFVEAAERANEAYDRFLGAQESLHNAEQQIQAALREWVVVNDRLVGFDLAVNDVVRQAVQVLTISHQNDRGVLQELLDNLEVRKIH